jgi:hypothetical protein
MRCTSRIDGNGRIRAVPARPGLLREQDRATARNGVANVLNLLPKFGSIADMAEITAGSTRPRMDHPRQTYFRFATC